MQAHLAVFLPPALSPNVVHLALQDVVGAGVDLGVAGLVTEHLYAHAF